MVPGNSPYNTTATIAVGSSPFATAVDPVNDIVFVTNSKSDNLSLLSGSSNTVLASVGVGSDPTGVAFDPKSGEVFVANAGSSNVTVISESTRTSVDNLSVGLRPIGVAFDNATGYVFVVNSGSNTVSVLNGTTHRLVRTVAVGTNPDGVAIDNRTDNVYVTNNGSSNISVISATTGTLVATIPVLSQETLTLQGLAYDSRTGQMWVGGGHAVLIIVNTTTESVAFYQPTDPSGAVYDPDTDTMCTTDTGNWTFECRTPSGPFFDNVSITFVESGLPTGVSWHVSSPLGVTQSSSTTSVTFEACVSWGWCSPSWWWPTYAFTIPASGGFQATPSQVNVTVTSGPIVVRVVFSGAPVFAVNFTEVGLLTGAAWSVDLAGTRFASNGATISFEEGNGSYPYTIPGTADMNASPSRGTVTVNGGAVTVPVTFQWTLYALDLHEIGLPTGSAWFVNFTQGPLRFPLPQPGPISLPDAYFRLANGSYLFTVTSADHTYATGAQRSLDFQGGSPAVVYVEFIPVLYTLTFAETGLPGGSNWSVGIGTLVEDSTSARIDFSEVNGTYRFTIGPVPGYAPSPGSGRAIVNGASTPTVGIAFTSTALFPATFYESGLPVGLGWAVSVGNAIQSTAGSSATIWLLNGSHAYLVLPPTGYTSIPTTGNVSVEGAPASVAVSFQKGAPPVSGSTAPGPWQPPGIGWIVVTGVVGIAALVVGALIGQFRNPRSRIPPPVGPVETVSPPSPPTTR